MLSKEHFQFRVPTFKKASMLFIACWAILFLGVFAVYMGVRARNQVNLVKQISHRDRVRSLAASGVMAAADFVVSWHEKEIGYHSLNQDWNNYPAHFRSINLGDGGASISYRYFDQMSETYKTKYGMVDESRKINIRLDNYARDRDLQDILKRLFEAIGGDYERRAAEMAASIRDWQDSDSQTSIPLGSAEDSYYRSLPEPYGCKDADLEILDELLLVRWITPAVFEKIKDYVTIYGNRGVNINTAPREVLMALGIPARVTGYILAYRAGEDEEEGTIYDNVFTSSHNIVSDLSQSYGLSAGEIQIISNLVAKGYLVTDSSYFMIKSRGYIVDEGKSVEITAVVDNQGGVVYWKEP